MIDATGHAAGGLPGERLLRKVGVACSADTILRHLKRRAAANRAHHPVRVVGIDDVAQLMAFRQVTPTTPTSPGTNA